MTGSKEFYDLQIQFEKDVPQITYGHKFERQPKNEKIPPGIFYQDGFVNTLFHAYMLGHQNGKMFERYE